MQQVYGIKVIILTRGGLTDNPCSNVWLNGQESAEAIVPEGSFLKGRAER